MIQLVVENLCIDAQYTFVCQREHDQKYSVEGFLHSIKPDCNIIYVDEITEGRLRGGSSIDRHRHQNKHEHACNTLPKRSRRVVDHSHGVAPLAAQSGRARDRPASRRRRTRSDR